MSEEMVNLALWPFDILATPSSQPAITWWEKKSHKVDADHHGEGLAMIDAVGEVCDCGDIGENGYGQAGDNDDGSG